MKVNKSQALLFMMCILLNNGSFKKEEILEIVEISDLQFKRYMQEIRAFIANFDMPYEINYSRSSGTYILKASSIQ